MIILKFKMIIWWQKVSQGKFLVKFIGQGSGNKFGSLSHSLVSLFILFTYLIFFLVQFTFSCSHLVCPEHGDVSWLFQRAAFVKLPVPELEKRWHGACWVTEISRREWDRSLPNKWIRAETALIPFQEILSWKAEPYQEWQCWECKAKGHTGFGKSKSTAELQLSRWSVAVCKNTPSQPCSCPAFVRHPHRCSRLPEEIPSSCSRCVF